MAGLLAHWIVALVIFVGSGALLFVVLAGKDAADALGGVLSSLVGIVRSPFVFVSRTLKELAAFGRRGEGHLGATRQYLLGKALLLAQAAIVLLALVAFAAGLTFAWISFLPPAELRERMAALKTARLEMAEQARSAETDMAKLDKDWAENREGLVRAARERLQRERQEAGTEAEIAARGAARLDYWDARQFDDARSYLVARRPRLDADADKLADDVANYGRNRVGGRPGALIVDYAEAWRRGEKARLALARLDSDPRDAAQPERAALVAKLESLARARAANAEAIQQLAGQMHYDPAAGAAGAARAVGLFLAVVWVFGALFEGLSLGVCAAQDIRVVRERLEGAGADPAPSAPVVEEPPPAPGGADAWSEQAEEPAAAVDEPAPFERTLIGR
ncbi:MAG: hypothetical protein ABFD84_04330 [Candidatus Polarisedimenticolia bacterium]|nr:hypothetical protein [bacterium]